MNVIGLVVPMFLDKQGNIENICALSKNIETAKWITFIYGSICSLHSRKGWYEVFNTIAQYV